MSDSNVSKSNVQRNVRSAAPRVGRPQQEYKTIDAKKMSELEIKKIYDDLDNIVKDLRKNNRKIRLPLQYCNYKHFCESSIRNDGTIRNLDTILMNCYIFNDNFPCYVDNCKKHIEHKKVCPLRNNNENLLDIIDKCIDVIDSDNLYSQISKIKNIFKIVMKYPDHNWNWNILPHYLDDIDESYYDFIDKNINKYTNLSNLSRIKDISKIVIKYPKLSWKWEYIIPNMSSSDIEILVNYEIDDYNKNKINYNHNSQYQFKIIPYIQQYNKCDCGLNSCYKCNLSENIFKNNFVNSNLDFNSQNKEYIQIGLIIKKINKIKLKQQELKESELKELELKELESKELELKQQELKESELKELELKELESKELELKQQEIKLKEIEKIKLKEIDDFYKT
jgi:hypothetical protein